ncbi:hypothetical protein CFIO01_12956 [Colletotrichum fioriniae PJ7]|uniref:Uncharacterized protein n=1 Tax=Colletotrichum fioriniae PJ7 TaxID=1445577 RepID=A0A010RH04_9PEZI|nr:hypothetical protein CFIO01_12956 [Colletotrichum fioriniae PJ7]
MASPTPSTALSIAPSGPPSTSTNSSTTLPIPPTLQSYLGQSTWGNIARFDPAAEDNTEQQVNSVIVFLIECCKSNNLIGRELWEEIQRSVDEEVNRSILTSA